jgi:hypothetical protein
MSLCKHIQWELAIRHSSPFFARRHLAVVPNVSWGLIPWEADLMVLQKNGYLHEVEIKVSMSDWRADAHKSKWDLPEFANKIRRFWYAVPRALANRHQELVLPDFAGVIEVSQEDGRSMVKIIREAKTRTSAQKLGTEDQMTLLRLGCLKAWRLAHHPEEKSPAQLDSESGTPMSEVGCVGSEREPDV